MEFALRVKNLVKTYAEGTPMEVKALRGINLEVKKGEMLAIMGPSGSGKTTLLNMIGGLDQYTSGEIWLGDKEISQFSDDELALFRAKNIGFIFQLFNLFPFLNAIENVMVPLLILGWPYNLARRRSEAVLRELGLGGHLEHKPQQLSGGQEQRVAVARAVVTNPQIVLGDEPTGDLDSTSAADIMHLFRRINREQGKTFILVTHSRWVAEQCDRIVHIDDGKLVREEKGPFKTTIY